MFASTESLDTNNRIREGNSYNNTDDQKLHLNNSIFTQESENKNLAIPHRNVNQNQDLQSQNNTLTALVQAIEKEFEQAADLLIITSQDPAVNNTRYVNNISNEYRGIPPDADIPKRKVAQNIIEVDKDFRSIYFLLPNGDIYI